MTFIMNLTTPSTSLSLIHRVGTNDALAWHRLVHLYGPVVYRWCRRRGIASTDAKDVMQEVFWAVAKSIERYQRDDGRQLFRSWLYGIASHKINDFLRITIKQPGTMPAELLDATVDLKALGHQVGLVDEYLSDSEIAEADRVIVLRRTLEEIRPDYTEIKWSAFWRTVVDEQPATAIAQELGLRPDHVRQIKYRVLRRLRRELEGLETDV